MKGCSVLAADGFQHGGKLKLWHALPARDEWLRLDCGKHLGEIWIGPGKVLVPLFDYVQGRGLSTGLNSTSSRHQSET